MTVKLINDKLLISKNNNLYNVKLGSVTSDLFIHVELYVEGELLETLYLDILND